jgi:hypothetical protein
LIVVRLEVPVAFKFVKLPVPEFTVLMLPVVEFRVTELEVEALVVEALLVAKLEVYLNAAYAEAIGTASFCVALSIAVVGV